MLMLMLMLTLMTRSLRPWKQNGSSEPRASHNKYEGRLGCLALHSRRSVYLIVHSIIEERGSREALQRPEKKDSAIGNNNSGCCTCFHSTECGHAYAPNFHMWKCMFWERKMFCIKTFTPLKFSHLGTLLYYLALQMLL